ncbi:MULTISPECIES: metallophosphoesterase [unclassified Psychrobacillus]|jgi:protein phosphatase|uniref:metallophosphoesterase n=1 Tax=unclassified Psychrobacillus TaxID=2636677 RepID=UPI001247182E|nr:metallophosphoesterase [Psychrobacillus sp. AK 1817]QEY19576.1 serine/threonine protein phosphatase [Psychrobacillus sp. AK 1817]
MLNFKRLNLEHNKRVIIISDIHGNLHLFKSLLEKVNYQSEDYLFINGDLCEKGDNSLEVIEFVRLLQESSSNVFITKGNCDVVHRYIIQEDKSIIAYMKNRKKSVLNEMLNQHGKSLDEYTSLSELSKFYQKHYSEMIAWLEGLPIAFETENFIVVHAGIDPIKDWKLTDEETALNISSFLDKGHQANKLVIVGHWPVINYRSTSVSSHNPMIDIDKNIISIDGGNQIKQDGQLNALIIEGDTYSYTYVDNLSKYIIAHNDFGGCSNRVGTVAYPNYELKIIRQEEYFTLCENVKLGIEQWIKNEYIIEKNGTNFCRTDLSTTFLPVMRGEKVWVVDDGCAGYMLVKNVLGEIGWIEQ